MKPCLANELQRDLFLQIESLPGLVLALKNDDFCALNLHGRFGLWDKRWSEADSETLLAFRREDEAAVPLTRLDGEPLVHLHVDWKRILYCRIGSRVLPRIATTMELAFAERSDAFARSFVFYSKDTPELKALCARRGSLIQLQS